VSDDVRQMKTHEQRALLGLAKRRGGLCGACGRTLGPEDAVWFERFWVGMRLFRDPTCKDAQVFWEAPVGIECASPAFVARMEGAEPEVCGGCGRGIHVDVERENRGPACCSMRCRARVNKAKQW
jgi:hypothetical protein